MNFIYPFILFFLCSCTHRTQTVEPTQPVFSTQECSNLYPFQAYYIDLDNLNAVLIDGIPAIDFKNCSKYSHRFNTKKASDSITIGKKTFQLNINSRQKTYHLEILEGTRLIKSIPLPVASPLPNMYEYSGTLNAYGNDVILVLEDQYTTHYTICKYNQEGKLLLKTQIEHTFVTHSEPNNDYHQRYLYFNNITPNQMIFSSGTDLSEKNKTVILSLKDFSTVTYDKSSCGIILDEQDKELSGFISKDSKYHYVMNMMDGKKILLDVQSSAPVFETILHENLLYFAKYNPRSTGSNLYCFDVKAGKMLWIADVKQPKVVHSQYLNKVTLSMYKNIIIMEGNEAAGNYVQFFDAASGKRLADFSDFK